MQDPEFVTLKTFPNSAEASLAKGLLAEAGIESSLLGEDYPTLFPGNSSLEVGIRLQVRASDRDRARDLLQTESSIPDEVIGDPSQDPTLSDSTLSRLRFIQALKIFLFINIVVLVPFVASSWFFYHLGHQASSTWRSALHAVDFLTAVFFIVFLTTRIKRLSWIESIRFLGFKKPSYSQIGVAILLLVPILFSHLSWLYDGLLQGGFIHLRKDWLPHLFSWFLLGPGLYEETLYRGFLFRLLRPGRSFFAAAAISGSLWSISHLSHLIPLGSLHGESIHYVLKTMAYVFADSFAGALLFERGGYVIWGWMLVHLGIDVTTFFSIQGIEFYAPGKFTEDYWIWDVLYCPISLFLIDRYLPASTSKEQKGPSTDIVLEDQTASRWNHRLLPITLIGSIFLSVYLVRAKGAADQALDLGYARAIQHHPRFAGNYIRWAKDMEKQRRFREMEDKCAGALAIDPKNVTAYLDWGNALEGQKKYDDAIKMFEKAASLDPKNVSVHLWWGYTLEGSNRYQEAAVQFRTVLTLDPYATNLTDYARESIDYIDHKHLAKP